jgi:CPA2 family monovalent cation:H+ antiporter-2
MTGSEAISHIAEMGVALLLFSIGLEFSFQRLKSLGLKSLMAGVLQIVATAVLGAVAAYFILGDWKTAFVLGLLMAPSSTACVLRLLAERAEMDSVHGRFSLGVLLVQDMAVIPLVVIITSISGEFSAASLAVEIGTKTGFLVLLVGLFVLASVYLLPRLLNATTISRNRELPILLAVSMFLASVWLTHLMGLSPALGAFIAGLLLAGSPYAAQLRSDVSTLRVLFVTLFFASVGLQANLAYVYENLLLVACSVFLVVVLKALVVYFVLLGQRTPKQHALATGFCLAQVGEFSFVLALLAVAGGLIDSELNELVLSVGILSLFLTPTLVVKGPVWAARLTRAATLATPGTGGGGHDTHALADHVILVGFGPAGRKVHNLMVENEVDVVVLELNPRTVEEIKAQGVNALLGDATQAEVLEHLHVTTARAVVITIPDAGSAVRIIHQVKAMADCIPVLVRARQHVAVEPIRAAGGIPIDEESVVGEELSIQAAHLLFPRHSGAIRIPPSAAGF